MGEWLLILSFEERKQGTGGTRYSNLKGQKKHEPVRSSCSFSGRGTKKKEKITGRGMGAVRREEGCIGIEGKFTNPKGLNRLQCCGGEEEGNQFPGGVGLLRKESLPIPGDVGWSYWIHPLCPQLKILRLTCAGRLHRGLSAREAKGPRLFMGREGGNLLAVGGGGVGGQSLQDLLFSPKWKRDPARRPWLI